MPPDRLAPDDPREWLNRARSNLALAKANIAPDTYLEDLCFEAQQAAEKAIKALLIKRGIAFPYVHDLARLMTLLEQAGEQIPATVREAEALTRYATATRYPGLAEPVTEKEYRQAVAAAESVLSWVDSRLRSEPG
jgi:HEPN domain-containing protein